MHTAHHESTLELEFDLTDLALTAAIALDNLSLGRVSNRDSIRELAESIRSVSSSQHMFDRTTALALHNAMIALHPIDTTANLMPGMLQQDYTELSDQLRSVYDGERVDNEEIAKLRAVCVELARSSIESLPNPFEEADSF